MNSFWGAPIIEGVTQNPLVIIEGQKLVRNASGGGVISVSLIAITIHFVEIKHFFEKSSFWLLTMYDKI